MLVVFVYGAGRFADGPINECGNGYCSTRHVPKTADDYHAYKLWEKAIFFLWPAGLAAMYFLDPRRQRPINRD